MVSFCMMLLSSLVPVVKSSKYHFCLALEKGCSATILPKPLFLLNYAEKIPIEYKQQLENRSQDQVLSSGGRFVPSQKVQDLRDRLIKFMDKHIYPAENELYKLAQSSNRWTVHPEEENLKELAKREGLWNLWIPVCICFLLSNFRMFII